MKRKPCSCGTISSSSACRIRVCQNMKKETETKICNKSELSKYMKFVFLGFTGSWTDRSLRSDLKKISEFICQKCNGNSPTWNLCLPFLPAFPEEINLSTTREGCEKSQRGTGGSFFGYIHKGAPPPSTYQALPYPLVVKYVWQIFTAFP